MLTKEIKRDLFNLIKKEPNAFGEPDKQDGILGFIGDIWDLESMESTDPRYKNASEDFIKHTVLNYDWDIDYQFIDRLKLLEDDDHFKAFIENTLKPKFRRDEDEIIKFVLLINPYLERAGLKLAVSNIDAQGLPIYTIQIKVTVDSLPVGAKINTIPFFTTKNPNGRSYKVTSHPKPISFPSFALVFNDSWNDYSMQTDFSLYYYDKNGVVTEMGHTKIMNEGNANVINIIPPEFKTLDDTYCSVGQTKEYYFDLKEKLGNEDFYSVMFALKDAAFFSQIQEKFERVTYIWSPLLDMTVPKGLLGK